VSPILVRPVREQLEHDRIIRLLQGRTKRRHESVINPGAEQNGGVGTGPRALFPDLVLYTLERGRKLQAVVEVETGESVNHLEALAQWAHLSKLKVPFHLYVPAAAIDVARRLASEYRIDIAELWIYDSIGDQVRFTLVQRSPQASRGAEAARAPSRAAAPRTAPAGRRKPGAPARPAKSAKRTAPARPRQAAGRKAAPKSGSRKKGTAQKRR
jgi:pyruvate/2-oxoglutarate dehydrogenase complex dihydrolipoamide acyltransferase (E2) component